MLENLIVLDLRQRAQYSNGRKRMAWGVTGKGIGKKGTGRGLGTKWGGAGRGSGMG
jgi:hypothetical protein